MMKTRVLQSLAALLILQVRATVASHATAEEFNDEFCQERHTFCGEEDADRAEDGSCPHDETPTPPETLTFLHNECVTAATDPEYDFLPDPNSETYAEVYASHPELRTNSMLMTCTPDGTFKQEYFSDEACTARVSGAALDRATSAVFDAVLAEDLGPGILTTRSSFMEDLETGISESPVCFPLARFTVDQGALAQYFMQQYGMDEATATQTAADQASTLEDIVPAYNMRFTCDAASSCSPTSLLTRIHEFQSACCDQPGDVCDDGGMPEQCSAQCADSFLEFYADCALTMLDPTGMFGDGASDLMVSFRSLAEKCATESGEDGAATFVADGLEFCVNVAEGQPATQDSVGWGGTADRAVDGNEDSAWGGDSCTHTNAGDGNTAWWQVDLGSVQHIRAVQLVNRADCCGDRINGAQVVVSRSADYTERAATVQCGTVHDAEEGDVIVMSCGDGDAVGRYVTVFNAENPLLSLCEVGVFAQCVDQPPPPPPPPLAHIEGCDNLATTGRAVASQSSTGYGGEASRAIDGTQTADWSGDSCTHTAGEPGAENWWQVDIGNVQDIGSVLLTNRADCCADRINGAHVVVSQTSDYSSGVDCGTIDDGQAGEQIAVECSGTRGRYVTVYNNESPHLTLCEVEVYSQTACAVDEGGVRPPPPKCCKRDASCDPLCSTPSGGGH